MTTADSGLDTEEINDLKETVRRLQKDANAKAVLLIDKDGRQVAAAGEHEQYDVTSLASVTAGSGSDDLAKLIRERELSVMPHEGQQDYFHISIVATYAILLVAFDARSSLGLVRLQVKRAGGDFDKILGAMAQRGSSDASLTEITDDDIERLFSA
ncbi:roadblock/LC7 domain-containing protein [Streptomyces chumphonensis]|uniref:Roadblock/LC7 domain-containing protein n=1 Tax=Streptomyces chumphonensis TaxID=1214925 RepID=A0A927F4L7_9ACTN|nr:roadblock/LC7 domain-containing protein [Streptomyces chumphonensis]MBD3934267.1 roadblock/LC7 domain-containing protein [Streptomyces chumphonensis]